MALKVHPQTAALALLLTLALPVAAVTYPTLADQWNAGLKRVDEKLREKNWKAARKEGRKAADQIVETAGTGQGAAYSLAAASALRAIAAAGLGDADEANWHWDMALNIFPDVAKTNLSTYGPEAAELKNRKLRVRGPEEAQAAAGPLILDPRLAGKVVTRPKIVKQRQPEFPKGLALQGAAGRLVVSTIIREDGRPREPVVLDFQGGGPAMEYVALDSLGDWRFEPATVDGKPVAVYYVLTVNFQPGK